MGEPCAHPFLHIETIGDVLCGVLNTRGFGVYVCSLRLRRLGARAPNEDNTAYLLIIVYILRGLWRKRAFLNAKNIEVYTAIRVPPCTAYAISRLVRLVRTCILCRGESADTRADFDGEKRLYI